MLRVIGPRLAFGLVFLLGVALGGGVVGCWTGRPPASADEPPVRWEATVYLPVDPNPEHPFSPADWDDALTLLVREFGGATLGPAVEGCWVDQRGRLQRERVRLVIVSFDHARLGDFRRVLEAVGRRLGQEALYTRFERPRVEIQRVP